MGVRARASWVTRLGLYLYVQTLCGRWFDFQKSKLFCTILDVCVKLCNLLIAYVFPLNVVLLSCSVHSSLASSTPLYRRFLRSSFSSFALHHAFKKGLKWKAPPVHVSETLQCVFTSFHYWCLYISIKYITLFFYFSETPLSRLSHFVSLACTPAYVRFEKDPPSANYACIFIFIAYL